MAQKNNTDTKHAKSRPKMRPLHFFVVALVLTSFLNGTKHTRVVVQEKRKQEEMFAFRSSSKRQEAVCSNIQLGHEWQVWSILCSASIAQKADFLLSRKKYAENNQNKIHIVQVGAHTGFEINDPLHKGFGLYFDMLAEEDRSFFSWTFVEPSPPNYKRLVKNISNKTSSICNMQGINAAVVSDSLNQTEDMVFYSINETIDPETGYDSRSGKFFPSFITQVSSLSMEPIAFNEVVWRQRGLKMQDYVVKTNVTILSYSEMLKNVCKDEEPFLVLLDTEGFDCDILLGISSESMYLPKFLIFEHKICGRMKTELVYDYLEQLDYKVTKATRDNTVAYRI